MNKLIETLNSKGFKVHLAQNKNEALEISKKYIKDGLSIGFGGSTSIEEIGLLNYVLNRENVTLYNQYEDNISMDENILRRRKGLLSDLFITGTNAISEDGYLINADGSGNRVAAMIFGPKKVLIVVGKNKIVKSKDDGLKRILDIAAFKNKNRLNSKAINMGKNPHYTVENTVNKLTYIKEEREKDRIVIILVNEELGF